MLTEINNKDLVYTQDKHYLLTSVVCDYGIYEKSTELDERRVNIEGVDYSLRLILYSRSKALEIMDILDKDSIEHKKLNEPISVNSDSEDNYPTPTPGVNDELYKAWGD